MVEVFGPLSARPPTPPRTSSRALPEKDRTEDSPVVAQTPGLSPFANNASNGVPSSRQSKRVNFSPWTKYIKPPSFANTIAKPKSDLKALPPSNERKPSKSILKPTNSPAPVNSPNVTSHTPESFVMLLKSMTSQLAGESASSRLDAYMQLFGALRTYDGLPGQQEVAECLGLITQFIQRDISRNTENMGPLDTNLVIQALKLSAALVWQTDISAQLSDEFKIFLIEHSVDTLHNSKVPKSILTHHMSILSTQNFSAKIMTTARLSRLLTVLHDLTDRVNGSSIVSQRLSIYQRILNQAKSTFVTQSLLWMEHLIFGLLHHIKDIRIKAISLGFQVSIIFGPNPTLSKCIQDIFDRSLDKGRRLVTEICERMMRMMAISDSGIHVPQVWSVVILLLRNKRLNVDHWDHFKEWVLVLQKCFNCSDPSIKAQAIVAWNRFVLVVSPDETTNRSLLRMLSKPILSQFERKKQDKGGSQPSQLVMCSYYNLLYYAFRPSASFQLLDIVWEEYIASPSSKTFASSPALSDRLAHILSNMLWSPQNKVWSENKVNESNKLEPEELPTLDCRWLRSRITLVLKVFENILKTSLWAENIEQSNIAIAWVRLSKALSNASSKEITPSSESMQTVAHVLGLLQRLWKAGPSSINAVEKYSMDAFFERFQFLSRSMIFSLGNIPFTEKLLLKTADATFQAANTPTHRHSHTNSNLDSPVLHFLRLISDVSGISEPSPTYLRLVNATLEAACNGRTSRSSRLELLRQCADLHSNEADIQVGTHSFARIVWKSVAHLTADSLCSYPIETARERDGSVSRDYENAVKILSTGLKFPDVFQVWNELLDAFVRVIRTEKGDCEIATMVVEPLAECLMTVGVRDGYLASASLFKHSLPMTYGQSIEGKGLEDVSHFSARGNLFVPKRLVELVDRTLQMSYGEFDATDTNGIADFIESLTSFLGSGLINFRSKILESLQQPLALWLKDETHKLNVESGVESRVLTAGRALSSAVLNILQASSPHDSSCLQIFEDIICAGLESSHMSVAKKFLEFWKSSFGAQLSIPCPEAIVLAVQRLETQVDTHASSSEPQTAEDRRADMSEKSRISFILDNSNGPSSAGFKSSPVTREPAPEDHSKEAQDGPLPANDDTSHEPNGVEVPLSFQPVAENPKKRSEMFSMIENLRSSSPPTNTPRELGFMTPPHLRNLRNPDRDTETPQTPTLPAIAADNDESFLGSSPTPGTRDRTQTSGSTLRTSLIAPGVASEMDIDPPSSPPEIRSQSPNSRRKSTPMESPAVRDKSAKNRRKKQRRKERRSKASRASSPVTQPDPLATPKETCETEVSAPPERPLSSRTRSSTGKMPEDTTTEASSAGMCQDPAHSAQFQPTSNDHDIILEDVSRQQNTEFETGTEHDEETRSENHDIPDSSSDDMETQIASQLEQDLEFAVVDDADEQANKPPVTRKRKREAREAAFSTPSNQEKRRSSRLSVTKERPVVEDTEPKSTRSKKSMAPSQIEITASSPAEGGPQKRRRHSKGSADNEEVTFAVPEQNPYNTTEKNVDTLESSTQKRRSNRISGHVAPTSVEETPVAKKPSPRPSRSARKQNTQPKDITPKASQAESPAEKSKTNTKATEKEKRKSQERPSDELESNEIPESSESRINKTNNTQEAVTTQASEPALQTEQQKPPPPSLPSQEDTQTVIANPSTNKTPKTKSGKSKAKQKPKSAEPPQLPAPETTNAHAEGEIIPGLQRILDNVKAAALDRNALKQIDDLLFDIRVETHEALRRHTG